MRINLFALIIFSLTLSGCVSKSDYKKLKKENVELQIQLENVTNKYNLLLNEKKQAQRNKNKKPFITKAEALGYIKDYFEFYKRDQKYRNVKIRRINDNSFKVSLEICGCMPISGCESMDDFCWNTEVRTLTVHNNGKYNF